MKVLLNAIMILALGLLFVACPEKPSVSPVPPPRVGPSWPTTRPYVADPNIIEGVGATDPHPSIEVMRERAANIVIQEISLQTAVTDSGVMLDYLRDFSDYYSDLSRSSDLLQRIQQLSRQNVLRYITFAEEWQDPVTGRYWRYGWMVKASDELNTLNATQDAALESEISTEFEMERFLELLENRKEEVDEAKIEQEARVRLRLEELRAQRQ